MTRKLYLLADAPLVGEARVLGIDTTGPQPRIVLDQTLFHVKGGGQLPDRGFMGSAHVLDVRHGDQGSVDHLVDTVENFSMGKVVSLSVDAEHRLRNTMHHTAGHLIAGVLSKAFRDLTPVGAHHFPNESRVEFMGDESLIERLRAELPPLLSEAISCDLPVVIHGDPEINRSIAIGDYSPIPCGGTHLPSVASLNKIEITGVRMKSGRLRISYRL